MSDDELAGFIDIEGTENPVIRVTVPSNCPHLIAAKEIEEGEPGNGSSALLAPPKRESFQPANKSNRKPNLRVHIPSSSGTPTDLAKGDVNVLKLLSQLERSILSKTTEGPETRQSRTAARKKSSQLLSTPVQTEAEIQEISPVISSKESSTSFDVIKEKLEQQQQDQTSHKTDPSDNFSKNHHLYDFEDRDSPEVATLEFSAQDRDSKSPRKLDFAAFRQKITEIFSLPWVELAFNFLVFLDWLILALVEFKPSLEKGVEASYHWVFGTELSWLNQLRCFLNFVFLIELFLKFNTVGLFFSPCPILSNPQIGSKARVGRSSIRGHTSSLPTLASSTPRGLFNIFGFIDLISVSAFWVKNIVFPRIKRILPASYEPRIECLLVALSALRPLRLLSIVPRFNSIINSLSRSLPLLGNLAFFLAFFFLLFGTLGLVLFKGHGRSQCSLNGHIAWPYRYCSGYYNRTVDGDSEILIYNDKKNPDYADPLFTGYVCPYPLVCLRTEFKDTSYLNFDNIFYSILTVYVVSSVEKWTDIMYRVMATVSPWASLFFISCVMVLNYWLVTLFVAVIARIFEKIREDDELEKYLANKASATNSAPAPPVQEGFEFQLVHSNDNESTQNYSQVQATEPQREILFGSLEKSILKVLPYLTNAGFFLIVLDLIIRSDLLSLSIPRPEIFLSIHVFLLIESTLQLSHLRQPVLALTESETPANSKIKWTRRGIWLHFYSCLLNLLVALIEPLIAKRTHDALSILAFIRIYRFVFKLPQIQALLCTLATRFTGILSLLGFILSCIVLVSPLAMHLVCLSLKKDADAKLITDYFGTLPRSMLTLFQIFSGEDWPEVMIDTTSFSSFDSKGLIIIFFVVWSGFSNFILLNLFIALTMESFELAEMRKHRSQIEAYVETATKARALKSKNPISPWNFYRYLTPAPSLIKPEKFPKTLVAKIPTTFVASIFGASKQDDKEAPGPSQPWSYPFLNYLAQNLSPVSAETPSNGTPTERDYMNAEFCHLHPSYDSTWFLFRPGNRVRKLCQKLTDVDSRYKMHFFLFNLLVWLAVIVAVVVALFNTPEYRLGLELGLRRSMYLVELDIVLGFFFLVEFGVRTIAHGFLLTPNAYLKHPWYVVDFVVLLVFLVDVSVSKMSATHFIQMIRAMKAFRTLRLMSLVPKVKDTIYGVFVVGLAHIFYVSCLLAVFILSFAFYGKILFQNQGASCTDPLIKVKELCVGEFTYGDNQIYMPRAWENYDTFSFATIGGALLVLVEILSGEKWVNVMYRILGAPGESSGGEESTSRWYCLYFVVYYVVGTVIALSMFVAVIIENYRRYTGAARLTSNQRRWIDLRKQLSQTVPSLRPTYTLTPLQRWCRRRAIQKEGFWPNLHSGAHALLLLCLFTEFYDQGILISEVKNFVLIPLLLISVADPVMRVVGLGGKALLRSPWITAHAILTGLALAVTLVSIFSTKKLHMYDISNILCLIVSLKLMFRFNSLSELALMASASLPDILMTLYAWLVLFVTYAILFMQIFGLTRFGALGSDGANFRTFGLTMLMLFRMTTGESWNDVMHDYAVQEPFCNYNSRNYLGSDCGNPTLAYTLFLSFNVLSMFIFSNLFVVIVMDNFNYCHDVAASFSLLTRQDIRHFKRTWSLFDRHAHGYIKSTALIPFIMALKPPFGMQYFDPRFSIRSLLASYRALNPSDPMDYQAYASWLDSKLAQIPHYRNARRRRRFNILYLHAISMQEDGKGLSFTNVLLLLSQYKLIDPDQCLSIQDLIQFKQTRKAIYNTYYREKALGMCRTWILRRNFLIRLLSQRNFGTPAPPMIYVDKSSRIELNAPPSSSGRSSHSFSYPHHYSPATSTSSSSWVVPQLPSVLSSSSPCSENSDLDESTAQNLIISLAQNPWSTYLGKAVLENDEEWCEVQNN